MRGRGIGAGNGESKGGTEEEGGEAGEGGEGREGGEIGRERDKEKERENCELHLYQVSFHPAHPPPPFLPCASPPLFFTSFPFLFQIEGRIAELGTIFHRLASLVSEQGESVTRIDDELTDTLSNIEAGHGELVRYYEGLSSGRLLMMKVIGVLMTFALIFLFFFS